MKAIALNMQGPGHSHGVRHKKEWQRSPAGTYPTEVIKDNHAVMGNRTRACSFTCRQQGCSWSLCSIPCT
eukprot:3060408-Prorocentrum_lima.AAC.1